MIGVLVEKAVAEADLPRVVDDRGGEVEGVRRQTSGHGSGREASREPPERNEHEFEVRGERQSAGRLVIAERELALVAVAIDRRRFDLRA